ncbi:hypothetical protein EFL81_10065 [Weissella confusa]|uniref:hypothetical protein n=1 Tax=Weissella confusa TaxID=1583 RepID=UPI00223B9D19|nr:hypothetical protein [Weissella confusa]MCS9997156.1 hypothetical protein [Weissella confusa]
MSSSLNGKSILLVTWHPVASVKRRLEHLGAKVEVIDAKSTKQNKIDKKLSLVKYDLKFVFLRGVHHATFKTAVRLHDNGDDSIKTMENSGVNGVIECALTS